MVGRDTPLWVQFSIGQFESFPYCLYMFNWLLNTALQAKLQHRVFFTLYLSSFSHTSQAFWSCFAQRTFLLGVSLCLPFPQLNSHVSVRVCAWASNCRPWTTDKAVSWVQWLWQRSDNRRDGIWKGFRECARSKQGKAWVMRVRSYLHVSP